MLITSNNMENKQIWTETAYHCCKTSCIIKTFGPNYAKIIILGP